MSVTVVHAGGSWHDIGEAYGEHLREPIQRAVGRYGEIAPELGGTVAELHQRLVPYVEAARRHAPARYAELAGMADGARIELADAMLLNCVEELTSVEACTTAATGRFLVHAEMWYADQTEIGVLVATPTDGPSVVAASCAGFLTGVGASSAGFAQGVQSAFARDERAGVPRVMPSRSGLCAADVPRAIEAACAPHRAGGYGYVISTTERHRILETSATRAELVEEAEFAVHTNHYQSSLAAIAAANGRDSMIRLASAGDALRDARLESLADCRALLCRDGFRPCEPGTSATIFGLACELDTGAICVSDGDPKLGRWIQLAVPE